MMEDVRGKMEEGRCHTELTDLTDFQKEDGRSKMKGGREKKEDG